MAKATSYATSFPIAKNLAHGSLPGTPERWRKLVIDTAVNTTIRATGTYGLLTFDIGEVFIRGLGIVDTTFTSTSNNGTLAFTVNDNTTSGALNSAITMDGTSMAAGKSIALVPAVDGTIPVYNATVAQQLEWTVATNAITAGKITLYLCTFNHLDNSRNG